MLSNTLRDVIVLMMMVRPHDRSMTPLRLRLAGVAAMLVVLCGAAQVPPATRSSPEERAAAYLAREVPAWRRAHPCYSCHNNGDAARALVAASDRFAEARPALDDTLAWLKAPDRWDTNGGGEGGADDKRLARIQFAHAAMAASDASLVPRDTLARAAEIVAKDQQPDGSWQLDSSDSIGSPATYGTALATAVARRTLLRSGLASLKDRVPRADRWLAGVRAHNTPDAAAVLFAFADDAGETLPPNVAPSIEFLRTSQGADGGWGPYATSPAEPFDTALAVIALQGIQKRGVPGLPIVNRAAIERGRRYLVARQLEDGSWIETTRPSGQASYAQRISTTAWALLALIGE
jgi:hypothetical protein